MLIVAKGGEKVLLHFVQDSPGDHVPLETIIQTLGIQAKVQPGQRPEVRHPPGGREKRGGRGRRGEEPVCVCVCVGVCMGQ
ncbi:UNVERIFIED_CONTAM: hypothetical protein FKN15_034757 [Acipenser sinensis]